MLASRNHTDGHSWRGADLFANLKNLAEDAVVDLVKDIKAAKDAGATDAELAATRDFQRKASFYVDFVMSDNSMGFHAPDEEARVLGEAINYCRQGQLSLRSLNRNVKTASASTNGKAGAMVAAYQPKR